MNDQTNEIAGNTDRSIDATSLSCKVDYSLEVAREDILKQLFGEVGLLLNGMCFVCIK